MKKNDLQKLIADTITELNLYSEKAVKLLMGTCAQESQLGKYRRQLGGGPALGIMQMEPATFRDICDNFLRFNPQLSEKIKKAAEVDYFSAADLENNDKLAICFARIHYLRIKESIPDNLVGQAAYWKHYYNTPAGKGTEKEYIRNFQQLCI